MTLTIEQVPCDLCTPEPVTKMLGEVVDCSSCGGSGKQWPAWVPDVLPSGVSVHRVLAKVLGAQQSSLSIGIKESQEGNGA